MQNNKKNNFFIYNKENEELFTNKIHRMLIDPKKTRSYFRFFFNFSCEIYKKLFFENKSPARSSKKKAVPFRIKDFIELDGTPTNTSKIEGKICTIFATYSADNTIPTRVVHALEEYSKVSDYIIVVGDYNLKKRSEYSKIQKYVNCAYYVRHHQYDFGSWSRAITYLKLTMKLDKFDYLIMVNDSVYGPLTPLTELYSEMDVKNTDFWGMSINFECVEHIQSFFYAFRKIVFTDELFQNLFKNIPAVLTWDMAIEQYELAITSTLSKKFTYCAVVENLCDNLRGVISGNGNPTVWPLDFVQAGAPFVKVKALNGKFEKYLCQSELDVLSYVANLNSKIYSDIINAYPYLKTKNYNASNTSCNPNLLGPLLENIKIVSFDIFDTLLIRPFVKPTDLFEYLSIKYNILEYAKLRIQAESNARLKKINGEVTLSEIYAEMDQTYKFMENIEFETELKLIKPNPVVLTYYRETLATSKKIICVSDTYFTQEQIKKMLIKCGYDKIDKLYLSSKIENNKGKFLFNIVANELNIPPEEILHIGDNGISDYKKPLNMGMHAVLINKLTDIFFNKGYNKPFFEYYEKNNLCGSILISMISHMRAREPKSTSFWYDLGYCLGGPFVAGYIKYIVETARENFIDKLFFCSRDGYILKKIYDKYYRDLLHIDSEYVYLSRHVGLVSTLKYMNDPRYLHQLLECASADIEDLQANSDFETNKKIYTLRLKDLQEWSSKYKKSFTNHLLYRAGNSKRIAVVDMTTTHMSAYNYAKSVLNNRIAFGIASASFEKKSTLHHVYLDRALDASETKLIMFLEELVTAPEPPIRYLDEAGNPVYGKPDKNTKNTEEILSGISKFIEDYMEDFAEDSLFVHAEDQIWLLGEYLNTHTPFKQYFLKMLTHSTEMDGHTNVINFGSES